MCGAVVALLLLINWNASRLNVASIGIGGGARTKNAIATRGFSTLPSGGTVSTATAQQGALQCVSTYKTDTPTAQCQTFCAVKFKRTHCTWCKCRACDWCPKGGDAIEEAAKDMPPPASPPSPPPPSSPAAASFVHEELAGEPPSSPLSARPSTNTSANATVDDLHLFPTPAETIGAGVTHNLSVGGLSANDSFAVSAAINATSERRSRTPKAELTANVTAASAAALNATKRATRNAMGDNASMAATIAISSPLAGVVTSAASNFTQTPPMAHSNASVADVNQTRSVNVTSAVQNLTMS